MSYGDAIDRLVKGPESDVVRVTIPEGLSRSEIAPLVKKAGIEGDYLEASGDTEAIPFRRYGAEQATGQSRGIPLPRDI